MGQTLTHGIYLPDEGERNCYNGLAANWSILDNSVGTVAEHTSALAGKAPAVHTHTKSDITDFPAYGNTAGTICEGNDSRLSDARTPVAHTHTKSDVTDLFNSANTWSANQTIEGNVAREYILKSTSFEIGQAAPASGQSEIGGLYLKDKNNVNHSFIGTYEDANGSSYIRILLRSKFTNNAKSTTGTTQSCAVDLGLSATGDSFLKPTSSGINNLGTSANQWKSVYAQSYYYNGTAWGLDKANVWSANNSFYGITIYGNQTNTFQSNSSVGEKGDASIFALNIQVQDKNHAGWSSSGVANIGMGQDQNGSYMSFALETQDSNNTRRNNALSFLLKPTDNSHNAYFFPNRGGTVELGTSTNKWKTLNGVNPGALSLPKAEYTDIDISAQGLNWDLTGGANTYTPTRDGWLEIWATRGSLASAYIDVDNAYIRNNTEVSVLNQAKLTVPVRNSQTYTVKILAKQCWVRIIKAEGNV